MDDFKYCAACLVTNVKMFDLNIKPTSTLPNSLGTTFALLLQIPSFEKSHHVCFECVKLMFKFKQFRTRCVKAQSILATLAMVNDPETVKGVIQKVDRAFYKLTSNLTYSFVITTNSTCTKKLKAVNAKPNDLKKSRKIKSEYVVTRQVNTNTDNDKNRSTSKTKIIVIRDTDDDKNDDGGDGVRAEETGDGVVGYEDNGGDHNNVYGRTEIGANDNESYNNVYKDKIVDRNESYYDGDGGYDDGNGGYDDENGAYDDRNGGYGDGDTVNDGEGKEDDDHNTSYVCGDTEQDIDDNEGYNIDQTDNVDDNESYNKDHTDDVDDASGNECDYGGDGVGNDDNTSYVYDDAEKGVDHKDVDSDSNKVDDGNQIDDDKENDDLYCDSDDMLIEFITYSDEESSDSDNSTTDNSKAPDTPEALEISNTIKRKIDMNSDENHDMCVDEEHTSDDEPLSKMLKGDDDKYDEIADIEAFHLDFCKGYATVVKLSPEDAKKELLLKKESLNFQKSPFTCTSCYQGFEFRAVYENHMKRHSVEYGDVECEVCNLKFTEKRYYIRHFKDNHEWKFSCKWCPYTINSIKLAKIHIDLHQEKRGYSCKDCGMLFPTSQCVHLHSRRDHVVTFACDACGLTFATQQLVYEHKKRKHWKVCRIDS